MNNRTITLFFGVIFLSACAPFIDSEVEPGALNTTVPTLQVPVTWGEIEKDAGYTLSEPFQQVVPVWNCDVPQQRNERLVETRTIARTISTNVVASTAVKAEAGVILANAAIEGQIASGYELEVGDEIQRSLELDLPVGPFKSVEFIVEWQPRVWSGVLPFSVQSGEGRIEYAYQRIAFGRIVGFTDHTEEVCGRVIVPQIVAPDTNETTEAQLESASPTTQSPPVNQPLWIEKVGDMPENGTQIRRDLAAGERLFVSGGRFQVDQVFCGEDATQLCILIYEASVPQTVILDFVIEGENYLARANVLSYDDLIRIHEPLFWQPPNCNNQNGCGKATIYHMKDGMLVTGPITMLNPNR